MSSMRWQRRIGEHTADTYFDTSGGSTGIVRWRLYQPLKGWWSIGLTIGETGGHLPIMGAFESFIAAKKRAEKTAKALGHRFNP